ncbi:MAG: hypothetical protein IPM79_35790 [Polyangiaceae bacterium]|nr:hypothetical protein [Polyangiaceae bacterium]
MLSWTNRNGHQKTLTWDSGGRLLSVTDAALATTTLIPTTTETGRVVTLESALGRARSYGLERAAGPSEIRTFTGADGLTRPPRNGSGSRPRSARRHHDQHPARAGPSLRPRRALQLSRARPSPSPAASRSPSPARAERDSGPRRWRLRPPSGPTRWRSDGRTWTITHGGLTREVATTSPEGRIGVELLDADGRVIGSRTRERCRSPSTTTSTAAPRRSSRARGDDFHVRRGRPAHCRHRPDRPHHLPSPGRRRPRPSGAAARPRVALPAYDLEATPRPSRHRADPAHGMTCNLVELLELRPARPPGGGPTSYSYDLDRALTAIEEPGPRLTEHHYDSRRAATSPPPSGRAITLDYDPSPATPSQWTGPTLAIHYSYDGGARLTSVTTSGAVAGEVTWEHDSAPRLTEERLDGAHSVTFAYDADDLLIQAGALTFLRDPTTGFATRPRPASWWTPGPTTPTPTSRPPPRPSPASPFSTAYLRDDLGRITRADRDHPEQHARLLASRIRRARPPATITKMTLSARPTTTTSTATAWPR